MPVLSLVPLPLLFQACFGPLSAYWPLAWWSNLLLFQVLSCNYWSHLTTLEDFKVGYEENPLGIVLWWWKEDNFNKRKSNSAASIAALAKSYFHGIQYTTPQLGNPELKTLTWCNPWMLMHIGLSFGFWRKKKAKILKYWNAHGWVTWTWNKTYTSYKNTWWVPSYVCANNK